MTPVTKNRIDWVAVKATLRDAQTALEQSATVDGRDLQRIFHERAERLAMEALHAQANAATSPLLAFRLGNETYGIELRAVAQVFPDTQITPVPGAPQPLLGVANLQGEVRSVFALRRLLGLPESHSETDLYILILRREDRRVGLQVESIDGVRQIALGELIEYEDASAEARAGYVQGMTRDKLIVLRTEKLFDS